MSGAFHTDTVVRYMAAERKELDPYNGHTFCRAPKRNRVTDLLEECTLDGTERNALSTSTMAVGLGYLTTRTTASEEGEVEGAAGAPSVPT